MLCKDMHHRRFLDQLCIFSQAVSLTPFKEIRATRKVSILLF